MHLNHIAQKAYENSRDHGFWNGNYDLANPPIEVIGLKLALIHSEVSEALEDARKGHFETVTDPVKGKRTGLPSELADIIIRVGDLAAALRIDLENEVGLKMDYNAGRPFMHGKLA